MTETSIPASGDDNARGLTDGQKTDGTPPRPVTFSPDTGWAWVVAFASMVNVFVHVGLYRSLGIFVVELMEIYDAPTTKVSLIFTCVALGFCTTSILYICGFGDIFHERALVAASSFLASGGFLVTFFSSRIEHVCVQGFCSGAAIQIAMAAGLSLAGRYFDKRRTAASGIILGGVSLGVLVFPPVLQWLLDNYTYRGTALICAGLTLNSLVCCSLMRPVPKAVKVENASPEDKDLGLRSATRISESKYKTAQNGIARSAIITVKETTYPNAAESTARNSYTNTAYIAEREDCVLESQREATKISTAEDRSSSNCFEIFTSAVRIFSLKDTKDRPANVCKLLLPGASLLKSPALPFLQMFMLCSSLGSECVVQFYPAFTRELGMSEYQSAFLLSIAGVGDLLSRVGMGLLGDCNITARYKLVMIPQFVLGTACFLSRFATEFWSQGIFAVVIGLTYGTGYAYKAVVLIDFFGLQKLNRLMGISNFMSGMGFVVGSPLIGYLRDLTGDYKVPFQTIGALLYVAGLSMLISGACVWRRNRKQDQYDLK